MNQKKKLIITVLATSVIGYIFGSIIQCKYDSKKNKNEDACEGDLVIDLNERATSPYYLALNHNDLESISKKSKVSFAVKTIAK